MSPGTLVNITELVGLPAAQLALEYGHKTAGNVELLAAMPKSPVPYHVPAGYAIPAGGGYRHIARADLRAAHAALIAGFAERGAVMVRSSGIGENPGQNPTYTVKYHAADPDGSFSRFEEAVHRLGDTSDNMGILTMPMVGRERLWRGASVFGLDNASFVADTHSPIHPAEAYIALVHGLGSHVVDAGADFIPVTARRDDGSVTSFGNQSEEFLSKSAGSVSCPRHPEHFRQQYLRYFDLESGEERALTWRELWPDICDRYPLFLFQNRLCGRETQLPPSSELGSGALQFLGVSPFSEPDPVTRLVGILKYFSECRDAPVQIEGAFVGHDDPVPYLYQLLEVPGLSTTHSPLTITDPHIQSNSVIGKADFTGPLVYVPTEKFWEMGRLVSRMVVSIDVIIRLKEIEARYGKSGYILLLPSHEHAVMDATPGCRLRLSMNHQNLGSHAVTLTRLRSGLDPAAGHVLGMNVKFTGATNKDTLAGRRPRRRYGHILVYDNAHLESNGEELAVDLGPEVSGWWQRIFG